MLQLPQCNTEWCLITFYQFPTERQIAGVTKFESVYSLYRPVSVERSEKSDTLYEIYFFSALFLTGDSELHSEDIIWSSAFARTFSSPIHCLCTYSIKHSKAPLWLIAYYIGEVEGEKLRQCCLTQERMLQKMGSCPALPVAATEHG